MAKEKKSAEDLELEAGNSAELTEEQLGKIATKVLRGLKSNSNGGEQGEPHIHTQELEDAAKSKTPEDVANEYWKSKGKDIAAFPHNSIYVTSDKQIFFPDVQGRNALGGHLDNHKDRDGKTTIAVFEFTKPV